MAYENAKRITKSEEMRVERNDQSIYDDGIVIGFWEGIESKYLEECIEWLNHPDNDEVASTETFFDIAFGVKLYHLHARFSEKEGRLYRILSKELNVAAPITQADSRWRIKSGANHRGSNDVQILELPYCDPLKIEEIIKENTELTYTNSIYTTNGGELSGTWHNIKTIFEIDEQTGRAKALWFLSKQANDDLHFAYYRNPNTFVVDFFKFDASETGLASLETDYYFDDEGNWYISADGTNYTEKNGTAATGILPSIIPASVIVDGAGTSSYDGTYIYVDILNERPRYSLTGGTSATKVIYWSSNQWKMTDQFGSTLYVANSTDDLPPLSGWTDVGFSGDAPAPTVEHSSASIAPTMGTLRTAIEGRMAHPVEITRSESTRFYQAHAHMEFFEALSTGNSVSYGTPLVTVTETIVEGAAELPTSAGTAEYNTAGTKETITNIVSPQRDPIKGTWSYIVQVIEKWAPHAAQETSADTITVIGTGTVADTDYTLEEALDENGYKWWTAETAGDVIYFENSINKWKLGRSTGTTALWYSAVGDTEYPPKTGWSASSTPDGTYPAPALQYKSEGDVGYVEGPSEIRTKTESLSLARGISSGYAALGSWAGGGKGRIRYDTDATELIAKKFVPYNVTLARRCTIRTTSRFYYYVKEPTIEQYPNTAVNEYPTDHKEPVEDMGEEDLQSSAPYLVSTESAADTGGVFETDGHLVRHNYSDGVFTLISYTTTGGEKDEIKFIRTYPAEGGGGVDFDYVRNSGGTAQFRLNPDAAPTDQAIKAGATVNIASGLYAGDHTITGFGVNPNDSNKYYVYINTAYLGDSSGTIVADTYGTTLVDEAGLKADPSGTLTDDDGLYMGHYIIEDEESEGVPNFYTEAVRHRILKVAESVYALVIETSERTIWKMDEENKWILNAEEVDVGYARPPSSPSLAGTVEANVPFVM